MKIAVLIARILLGLMFLVFGLNGFLNFLHMPMPPGPAGQYMGVLFGRTTCTSSSWWRLSEGCCCCPGQFIPLALVLLGPVIVQHPSLPHFSSSLPVCRLALFTDASVVHRFLRSADGRLPAFSPRRCARPSCGFWDWPRYTAHRSAG